MNNILYGVTKVILIALSLTNIPIGIKVTTKAYDIADNIKTFTAVIVNISARK